MLDAAYCLQKESRKALTVMNRLLAGPFMMVLPIRKMPLKMLKCALLSALIVNTETEAGRGFNHASLPTRLHTNPLRSTGSYLGSCEQK